MTALTPTTQSSRKRGTWNAALINPTGIVATLGLLVLVFLMVWGPHIWGDTASLSDPLQLSKRPSAAHMFGTDAGGRDILARTLTATQLSVLMALAASAIGIIGGVILGALPHLVGRHLGKFVVAAFTFLMAFPGLLITIVLSIIFGQGATGAILAIGIAITPVYARLTHTLAASIAGRDYIAAAQLLGVNKFKILIRHTLPNIAGPLIVNASVTIGGALIAFAGLSFLGLGVQAPDFDWGRMLNEGITKIYVNPATALAPGAAIVFAGIVFTLVGETLARGLGISPGTAFRLPRWQPRAATTTLPECDENTVLRVSNLRVSVPQPHGWVEKLHGVNFTVARGETVGIVGESGSGKSLTCMALAGLTEHPLKVTADSLHFDGVETAGRHNRATNSHFGRRLAMVFQDPMTSLNPALKIGTQLAEVGFIHGGANRTTATARAIERLRAVHIKDPEKVMRQHPHELSGGMRQRVMIAMGLMGEPSLIIADEPTTALDVTVQREVLGVLSDVQSQTGAALLFISHDIAVVTSLCTRILVMYGGEIVEEIATTDLIAGHAQHPYTRALMAAVPTMTTDRNAPMATIAPGQKFTAAREDEATS